MVYGGGPNGGGLNRSHRPVDDDDRDAVRRLHAEGHSRNEIARRTGRSGRVVSVLAAEMNLLFDRAATAEATRCRMIDLAEKRSILAEALTDDALRLSSQIWEPSVVYNIGGKDNKYTEQPVPEPPAADKRQLMAAATAAAAQALRLVPPTAEENGLAAARSVLSDLADGIKHLAGQQEDTEEG